MGWGSCLRLLLLFLLLVLVLFYFFHSSSGVRLFILVASRVSTARMASDRVHVPLHVARTEWYSYACRPFLEGFGMSYHARWSWWHDDAGSTDGG